MIIGVVSDTHNHLGNVGRMVELFNDRRVECVVHTGDVTQAKTLEAFADLRCGLIGVYGNNDERRPLHAAAERLGFSLHEPPLEVFWHERSIVVVHDPRDLDRVPPYHHELALHGHTHRRVIERSQGRLVFNPGESAGHMPGRNAIGIVNLADLEIDLLEF